MLTKNTREWLEFKQSESFATLMKYMRAESGLSDWMLENRIWTAFKGGWEAANLAAERGLLNPSHGSTGEN